MTPLSGPLASYGSAGAAALRLWAEGASAELTVHDAHPDPVAALRSAEEEHPDVLFGPYGSSPARTVCAATQRLVWNHGGAQVPPSPRVVNVLAPARTYFEGAVRTVVAAAPDVRRATVLHGPTEFGRAVGGCAAQVARELGLEVAMAVLPVPPAVPDSDADASSPSVPDGDLLLVVGGFEEEQAAAERLLPGRWRAASFVGAGTEEVLAGLGARREGLLGPAQWIASAAPTPDEGPTAARFVTAYRGATGGDPPYPAAQAFAAGVLAARCVRDAGTTEDTAVRAAAGALDCTTLFARFRLDPATGEQVGHKILTVQWQDGRRVVVWPPEQAHAAVVLGGSSRV